MSTVMYYTDVTGVAVSRTADYLRNSSVFDLIYMIDKNDSRKYGLINWPTIYSKSSVFQSVKPLKGVYFCGVPKGRTGILIDCANEYISNDIDFRMDLICKSKKEIPAVDVKGINILDTYLSYKEVLFNELNMSCVLEVIQMGQEAATLRAYEVVVYNRKLLTNNKNIFSFPLFDSRYMKYFEKIDDIDFDWINEEISIDYHYEEQFSPRRLLDDIKARILEIK